MLAQVPGCNNPMNMGDFPGVANTVTYLCWFVLIGQLKKGVETNAHAFQVLGADQRLILLVLCLMTVTGTFTSSRLAHISRESW